MATAAITDDRTAPARPLQIDIPGFDVEPGDTLVDVGCGDGVVCAYAAARGADVVAIDNDPDCLALVAETVRDLPVRSFRAILSDCAPIPLPDGHATVVVATEVMEHVDDPAAFLAELARVGRVGARYLISVPDPASEQVMRGVAPPWYWKKPYHRHVFEHETVERLLASTGLEVASRHFIGFYQSLWWTFRMALGARPFEPPPDAPLLRHWEAAWQALNEAPLGTRAVWELDQQVPKSQVYVARKAGRVEGRAPSPAPSRTRSWRRRVRDGAMRVGGIEVHWKVRRARGPAGGGRP